MLKTKVNNQQIYFSYFSKESNFTTEASFVIACNIVKEISLDLVELKDTTRGVDIKVALETFLVKANPPINKLVLLQTVHQQWLANMLDLLAS